MTRDFDIVILGLCITSSWGNGHATTYRSLVRGLAARGCRVLFLERDAEWYAGNRDQRHPQGAVTEIYSSFDELIQRFEPAVRRARLVIVGSFVPEGARIGEWVNSVASGRTAFYDIDTPVTLAQLENGESEYVTPELIGSYDAYFSFTGGPLLRLIESDYGSPFARVLYCSVDSDIYRPERTDTVWDLGYLGTYSADRQFALDALLLEAARRCPRKRFAVVGPMYPDGIVWPENVWREIHLSPSQHAKFYGAQRFTLNLTRGEMKRRGFSPSVRLFEAGACGVPIVSDWWEGLDQLFRIGEEVLIAETHEDTLRYLQDIPEARRAAIGQAARQRILAEHTSSARALQLETYLTEIDDNALPHTARRDRHDRKVDHRLASGLASQSSRQTAGAAAGAEDVARPPSGHLYQPSGTSSGNGRGDRGNAIDGATPVQRTRRMASGRMGGALDSGAGQT